MESSTNVNLGKELINQCTRFLVDESLPRIDKCLEHLSEKEIWIKTNKDTPSVGNLILHLAGNVHQWILATLGGEEDTRNRSSEFNEKTQPSKSELLDLISGIVNQSKHVLKNISADNLLKKYLVQTFEETGIGILIHVVEHFSYHVGQITYFVKSRKGIDLAYYSGLDLDQTN